MFWEKDILQEGRGRWRRWRRLDGGVSEEKIEKKNCDRGLLPRKKVRFNVANRIQNNGVVLAHSWQHYPALQGGLDWGFDWSKREQRHCSGVHIHRAINETATISSLELHEKQFYPN